MVSKSQCDRKTPIMPSQEHQFMPSLSPTAVYFYPIITMVATTASVAGAGDADYCYSEAMDRP
jgi:hypothetical protein